LCRSKVADHDDGKEQEDRENENQGLIEGPWRYWYLYLHNVKFKLQTNS